MGKLIELSKFRTDDRALDWVKILNQARSGDTLTINSLADIGNQTVRGAVAVHRLIQIGVLVDSSAVCDDPHQLFGMHSVKRNKDRSRQAYQSRDSGNKGGRKHKYTDGQIRLWHSWVRGGTDKLVDVPDLYGISINQFRRRCIALRLPWPPTHGATE